MSLNFLVRAKGDCTGEMGAGQFSIFGAVEEKGGRDFPESGGMKQRLSDASFLRWMAAVFVDMKRLEENLVEWAAGISTEGAQEMLVSRFQEEG